MTRRQLPQRGRATCSRNDVQRLLFEARYNHGDLLRAMGGEWPVWIAVFIMIGNRPEAHAARASLNAFDVSSYDPP